MQHTPFRHRTRRGFPAPALPSSSVSAALRTLFPIIPFSFLTLIMVACNGNDAPTKKDIATTPEELQEKTSSHLRETLQFASGHAGSIGDSVLLFNQRVLDQIYTQQEFRPSWSDKAKWNNVGDSVLAFIGNARYYGLYPEDYHFNVIHSIRSRFLDDSTGKGDSRDASLWSRVDLLLSDGLLHMAHDLKLGRLPADSVSFKRDSLLPDALYQRVFAGARKPGSLRAELEALEPRHPGYRRLREALPAFLGLTGNNNFTTVVSAKESQALFESSLRARLHEGGYLRSDTITVDSVQLAGAIKLFQEDMGLAADGKVGAGTLRMLNFSDRDRFASIAITLDRYKQLPDTMPDRYIWVNLPAYYMELRQGDSVPLTSKIVCGKPLTRTPLLTSSISNMVTYPQWTIPNSIIVKEILPAVKKNPGYLAKKGFSLIDERGDEVDPYQVDWSKYSKGIPYRVVQGSGDANALGILKFNFPNKYQVYLHDTNQRYLFGQAMRSLSHGCVRVQQWRELAYQIVRYDNRDRIRTDEFGDAKPSAVEDSMNVWLERKEKHTIGIHNRLPVYIRYFTCEAKDGKLVFFDDIYGEDRRLQKQYFARK